MASPVPPPTPGSSIPRPGSVTGHHTRVRRDSDSGSIAGGVTSSLDPDQRNVRVGEARSMWIRLGLQLI